MSRGGGVRESRFKDQGARFKAKGRNVGVRFAVCGLRFAVCGFGKSGFKGQGERLKRWFAGVGWEGKV